MSKQDDHILGKRPEELFQPPQKKDGWKIMPSASKDNTETFFKIFRTANMDQSLTIAQVAARLSSDHTQPNSDTYFSVSFDQIMIVLHGFSSGPVPKEVHALASAIDAAIMDLS